MTKYRHILGAVAAQPWAMRKEELLAMLNVVAIRAAGGFVSEPDKEAAINPQRANAIAKKEGGIAIVPVYGVLSQRMNMFSEFSGGASTERTMRYLKEALDDSSVKAIVLDVDSPGGSVFGVKELGDFIMANRGDKPIVAQINSLSASGGYWITACCDDVAITPGGEVGSIGVYMLHDDYSKFLEDAGIKETFIFAGKHKVEGNPFEPLTDEAREYFQSRVDEYYELFVDSVARGRNTTTKNVIENFGQGRIFGAKRAVELGMADRVATLDETLARYGASRRSPTNTMKRRVELAQKI